MLSATLQSAIGRSTGCRRARPRPAAAAPLALAVFLLATIASGPTLAHGRTAAGPTVPTTGGSGSASGGSTSGGRAGPSVPSPGVPSVGGATGASSGAGAANGGSTGGSTGGVASPGYVAPGYPIPGAAGSTGVAGSGGYVNPYVNIPAPGTVPSSGSCVGPYCPSPPAPAYQPYIPPYTYQPPTSYQPPTGGQAADCCNQLDKERLSAAVRQGAGGGGGLSGPTLGGVVAGSAGGGLLALLLLYLAVRWAVAGRRRATDPEAPPLDGPGPPSRGSPRAADEGLVHITMTGGPEAGPRAALRRAEAWGDGCAICLDTAPAQEAAAAGGAPFAALPCGHAFHEPCVQRWLAGHSECPLCRRVGGPDLAFEPI